jgi:hypothetical protein
MDLLGQGKLWSGRSGRSRLERDLFGLKAHDRRSRRWKDNQQHRIEAQVNVVVWTLTLPPPAHSSYEGSPQGQHQDHDQLLLHSLSLWRCWARGTVGGQDRHQGRSPGSWTSVALCKCTSLRITAAVSAATRLVEEVARDV